MVSSITTGRHDYTLDDKNRLVMPPAFREELVKESAKVFHITLGLEGCLWVFLPSQWTRVNEELHEVAKGMKDKSKARAIERHLLGNETASPVDDLGRILIPQALKEAADLKKDVVVVGAGKKIEIWDRARWTAYSKKEAAPSFKKLAKDIYL